MTSTPSGGNDGRLRALVTGASSGIGAAFAERLAHDGYDLVITARDERRLKQLAQRLSGQHGAEADILVADLADADGLRRVEERVAAGGGLDVLINNAGLGHWSRLAEVDTTLLETEIRVNVLATTRIARAALPGMIARGSGALINLASLTAFEPVPNFAVYCATKAYIIALTQALHGELAGTGVRVQVLIPGRIRTEFFERAGRAVSTLPAATFMEPAEAVQASLAALDAGELFCMPGLHDYDLLTRTLACQADVMHNGSAGPSLPATVR